MPCQNTYFFFLFFLLPFGIIFFYISTFAWLFNFEIISVFSIDCLFIWSLEAVIDG